VVLVTDSRSSDKKRGRPGNDLNRDFVAALIRQGCCYCGETEMRITLDRIDNSLAHTRANVLPACLRCNYMRGSMPYEAWLHLVPAVRQAREFGLFGAWRSQPFNRRVDLT